MSSHSIQPSYQSFCRLTQNDDSSYFSFFFNFEQGQTKHQIEIKTTLNKARVISQKVNTYYQTDPTIQYIEINIPSQFKINEDQTQLKDKIENIFQTLLNSISTPKTFSKDDSFLLNLLMKLLEYDERDKKNSSNEMTKFINTISEAVSLLRTSFHLEAVEFLSLHLIEFLKSDIFEEIEEQIILDIIDFYIERNKSEQTNEMKQIFNILKDNNEPFFLIHLLLHVDENILDNDMIKYIINHIDDEIAAKEMPSFAAIAKKYFQTQIKNLNVIVKYTGSLQTVNIPADGEYEIEAIGASGSGGNTYGTSYTSQGGKGAKIIGTFSLMKGDVIDIVVGGIGTSKQSTAKDGASGGGGGGTFIFKRIDSVKDERYQFTKGEIKYEALLVAAGGSGGEDSAYMGHSSKGHDGEASNYKSPNNFTEYSKSANDYQSEHSLSSVHGISQFIQYDAKGTFYNKANGFGRGGYGCGASRDDGFPPGGGWCQGSNEGQATSWSLDPKAVGTDGFNEGNGSVTIKFKE